MAITPTNLAQYYSGQGQALPGLSQRASQYQTYGLGNAGSYAGTAAQNAALLGKLMGSSGGYAATPASGSSSAAGYSSGAPSGDPTLNSDISSLDQNQNDYQSLAASQAAALNDPNQAGSAAYEQNVIQNAYQNAMQETGLKAQQDTYNTADDAYVAAQGAANEAPLTALENARGGTTAQAEAAGTTNAQPLSVAASNDALALVPMENALNTTEQNTQQIAGQTVTGAQLAEQGFTQGQQKQLDAIQSKIAQGQALTNDEYQSYSALTQAQIGAAAQVKAAGISAGGAVSAAQLAANASTANTKASNDAMLKAAALQYPGITANPGANGTYVGAMPSYLTGGMQGPLSPAQQAIANKYGF